MKVNLSNIRMVAKFGKIESTELPNGNYVEEFVDQGSFYYAKYKSKFSDVNVAKDSLIATSKLKKIVVRAEVAELIYDNATTINIDDVNYSIIATEDIEFTNQTLNEYVVITLEKVEQSN